jgi:NAD(P)-dependent dehydrogenase (short-subunit alcohol dehydrogenase family)
MNETAPLAGRVAFVTGASSGLGRATALALARAGASVARGASDLATVAAELRDTGGGALPIACDLASSALRDRFAPRAASAGRVARSGRSSDARATAGPAASDAVRPASPPIGTTGSHGSPRAAWFHRSAATQYGERPRVLPSPVQAR